MERTPSGFAVAICSIAEAYQGQPRTMRRANGMKLSMPVRRIDEQSRPHAVLSWLLAAAPGEIIHLQTAGRQLIVLRFWLCLFS